MDAIAPKPGRDGEWWHSVVDVVGAGVDAEDGLEGELRNSDIERVKGNETL